MKKPTLFGVLLLFFVGGIFIFMGLKDLVETIGILRVGREAQGVIVGTRTEGGAKGVTYHPLVEFLTPEGQKVRFKSVTGFLFNVYTLGKTLPVVYDPRNPTQARIKNFYQMWGADLFWILVGSLVCFGIVNAMKPKEAAP